jgi:hypothetical protein
VNTDVVLGGVVGAVAASVLALSAWAWSARSDVRLNNLRVTARDEDLRTWAEARRRRLVGELQTWNDKFNIAQPAGSGQRTNTLINVKAAAGDQMRERLRQAEAARREILAGEDGRHRFWRFVWYGRLPRVRAGDDQIVAELAGLDQASLRPGGAGPLPPLIS